MGAGKGSCGKFRNGFEMLRCRETINFYPTLSNRIIPVRTGTVCSLTNRCRHRPSRLNWLVSLPIKWDHKSQTCQRLSVTIQLSKIHSQTICVRQRKVISCQLPADEIFPISSQCLATPADRIDRQF